MYAYKYEYYEVCSQLVELLVVGLLWDVCVYIPAVGMAQHGRDVNLPVGVDLNVLQTLCMHHAYMRRIDGCVTGCVLVAFGICTISASQQVYTPDRPL